MKLVKASEFVETIQYRLRFKDDGQNIFEFDCDENGENVKLLNKEMHDMHTLMLKNKAAHEIIKCIVYVMYNDIVKCGCGQEFEVDDDDNIECFCGAEYMKDGKNLILKLKTPERYIIRNRETGNLIVSASSYEEALAILHEFENQDKMEGNFVPHFYEIVYFLTLIKD